MQFNRLQFVALIKVGKMMSLADGVVQRSEVKTMCDVVASFGVSNSDFESMLVHSLVPSSLLMVMWMIRKLLFGDY